MQEANYTYKNMKKANDELKEKLSTVRNEYKIVEGKIIDYKVVPCGEDCAYVGVYEYMVDDKKYIYDKTLLESAQFLKRRLAETIKIYYNPNNPEEAYSQYSVSWCENFNPVRDTLIVIIGLLIIFLVLFGIIFLVHVLTT